MSRTDQFLPPMNPLMRWRVSIAAGLFGLYVGAVWGLGVFAGWGFPGYARAADVQQQQAQTNAHLHGIDVTLLEQSLRSNQRSLFDVQSRMSDKRAAHQPIDPIYTNEEQRLKDVIDGIEKQLDLLRRQ